VELWTCAVEIAGSIPADAPSSYTQSKLFTHVASVAKQYHLVPE